jgi:hypothetical protein
VGVKLNNKDFTLLMAEIDISGDGKVEFSEFSKRVLDNHPKRMAKTGQDTHRALM